MTVLLEKDLGQKAKAISIVTRKKQKVVASAQLKEVTQFNQLPY